MTVIVYENGQGQLPEVGQVCLLHDDGPVPKYVMITKIGMGGLSSRKPLQHLEATAAETHEPAERTSWVAFERVERNAGVSVNMFGGFR